MTSVKPAPVEPATGVPSLPATQAAALETEDVLARLGEYLRELLGIPAGVRPLAWLCLGPVSHVESVPDLERHGWRTRRPLHAAVHTDRSGRQPE